MSLENNHFNELVASLKPIVFEIDDPNAYYSSALVKFASADKGTNLSKSKEMKEGFREFFVELFENGHSPSTAEKASAILKNSVDQNCRKELDDLEKEILAPHLCAEILGTIYQITNNYDIQKLHDTLVAGDLLVLKDKLSAISQNYHKATAEEKHNTLSSDLQKLGTWCEKQSEKDSHLEKVGKYISSALGFLKAYISGNENDKNLHKANMKQIMDKESLPLRKEGIKNFGTEMNSYADKLKQERQTQSSTISSR